MSLSNLYYLTIEKMSATESAKMSGWELWHRRLAHSSIRNIQEAIPHTNGMEELLNQRHADHLKCPACMIGKFTLEDYPSRKVRATKPLRQVDADAFSSSVVSIEMQWSMLTHFPVTYGCMEWRPRMVCLKSLRNGMPILQISDTKIPSCLRNARQHG
jgi:hypothetical protein